MRPCADCGCQPTAENPFIERRYLCRDCARVRARKYYHDRQARKKAGLENDTPEMAGRNRQVSDPWGNLAADIIASAVRDYRGGIKEYRITAREFFRSEWLVFLAEAVGVDPEYIRENL
jgi:hypothetical protein